MLLHIAVSKGYWQIIYNSLHFLPWITWFDLLKKYIFSHAYHMGYSFSSSSPWTHDFHACQAFGSGILSIPVLTLRSVATRIPTSDLSHACCNKIYHPRGRCVSLYTEHVLHAHVCRYGWVCRFNGRIEVPITYQVRLCKVFTLSVEEIWSDGFHSILQDSIQFLLKN